MVTITLVRHGTTESNLRREFTGWQDVPLAETGRDELRALPYTLPKVEAVFRSSMLRCQETAAILYPDHKPEVLDGLKECGVGEFEGLSHDAIIKIPGYEGWGMTAESMVFPGGEEEDVFFRRVLAAFLEVAARCESEGYSDVAIVTHGGVIMSLMEQLCVERRDYFDWRCPNGGGYLVTWDGEGLALIRRLGA